MVSERSRDVARKVSVVAATVISLACGTNYAYSAWAPQFAARLHLSSTQSNLIGVFGNLGMYASGIPVGLLVDSKGPRPGVLCGSVMLGVGYIALYQAYVRGLGAMSMLLLCLFSFLTGAGGCAAFFGAIKTSALNWPNHRGTATAFPLSAFGLSAFFFSSISTLAFPNDTSSFLLMLAVATFVMVFLPSFFLLVIPHSSAYTSIPSVGQRSRRQSSVLHRRKSTESRTVGGRSSPDQGIVSASSQGFASYPAGVAESGRFPIEPVNSDPDETSSLMSKSSISLSDDTEDIGRRADKPALESHRLDVRGLALLPKLEFWILFTMMGLLAGIGLMTINNIGNDAQALWSHYDHRLSPELIQRIQLMHVSILSVLSFVGRLISGIGSDLIVKRLHMSRYWCLVISSCIFCAAQICGASLENPHRLIYVSGSTGLAYGFLFGVYPSLVAEAFGVNGLSQNWGCMTMAPVICGNIFNLLYGLIYDYHSSITPDDHQTCPDGLRCYSTAYWITFGSSLAGILISLWSVRRDHTQKLEGRRRELKGESRDA